MSRARTMLFASLALAATGVGAVLAQTDTGGLDLEAIQARARTEAAALAALASHAQGDQTQTADAQALIDTAKGQLASTPGKANTTASVPGTIDLDDIVAQAGQITAPAAPAAPQFLAFASLSMPPEALMTMIEDVSRAGGTVVFRGFSPKGAGAFMAGLNQAITAGTRPRISIDPRLFKAFHIEAVPTYVAVGAGFTRCSGNECDDTPPASDRLSGNVTTLFAAETIAEGNGPGAPAARTVAQALQATR